MSDEAQRMAEAEAAETALSRFLRPAFAVCEQEYIAALAKVALKPLSTGTISGIANLSVALKVLAEVRGQIETIIADGRVAQHDAHRAARIAGMSPEALKWATR